MIIPAILVKTFADFEQQAKKLSFAPLIQIDVMDGEFVPNKSFDEIEKIKELNLNNEWELHLMVNHPERIIEQWKALPKCKRIIWHVEAEVDHLSLIEKCREMGKEVGLAISPKTTLMELAAYLDRIETVLVMGVEPGSSGQSLLPETVVRLKKIHEMNPDLPIEVDGGVNEKNLLVLAKAGATRFAMNSAVYHHPFPRDFVRGQLQRLERLIQ